MGTAKINKLKSSSNSPNQVVLKRVIDEVGKEMVGYSEKVGPEVMLFKQLAESSIENATKLIEWSYRDNLLKDSQELKDMRSAMIVLRESGAKSKLSMLSYRVATEKIPSLTTLLSKGKREVLKTTDELIEEIGKYLSRLDRFIENIEVTILEIGN